ncbi:MAG TPA: TIGR04551 family protein, partial [Anaeromyxobacter sp.]|nr:TIGR04551 family protein [Anaeromyxobacter sp.]
MSRLLAALAALLLVASPAAAQEEKKTDSDKKADSDVDAKTKAAIQKEVEKAKEDIRNEVRAEIQGAQSAAEFLGAVAEGPKLEFLQLDGYMRVRGQLLVNMSLTGKRDVSGNYLFPVPLQDPASRETLNTANMRFRLEPTLNVSEHVRVKSQLDILDNYVLGSSTSALYDDPGSPYPVPFYGSSRVLSTNDPRVDRPAISPKRAWAEIQTPLGLLGFGRMPSEWGMGILANAGGGIDDDFGDSVDRIQFALPAVSTPLGRLTFVPILDFDNEGVLYRDPHAGNAGVGQPFDAESGDDGRTYGIKIAKLDTEDEIRRKLERNQSSVNFGIYYNYRTQRWFYPQFNQTGLDCTTPDPNTGQAPCGEANTAVHRSAYAHIADFWFRWLRPRFKLEAEVAGVYGQIGNIQTDPNAVAERILLRQWGGTVNTEWQVSPNKVMLGWELGAASGDDAPGFGNIPSRGAQPYGSFEGQQWVPGRDRSIRNFRFNPAYRVDLVLFRHLLGQVTDAWYLKPKLRWDILPGLRFDAAVIYSQAMYGQSTPSAAGDGSAADNLVNKGHAPLGLEADTQLTYTSGDGFQAWLQWGVLQPLSGFKGTAQD